MAMKKKFLPLLMAGMVVVGTTGLVNADTTDTTTVTGNNTQTLQSSVTVSGSVTTSQGVAPEGKLTVELPTRMAFAVDQSGNLTGGTYTVKNSSKDNIDVYVSEFKQTSGNIELVDNIVSGTSNRSQVKLTLTGDQGSPVNLKTIARDTLLAEIGANDSESIILGGEAGTQANETIDRDGATGQFNMVFKVKKHS
nr:hypothetical protein [uncultured Romboutsia sp.]